MEKCPNKCLQLSFFRLITHLNKAYWFCFIFARNNWDLASIGLKGRSFCERGLMSSASREQGPLVLEKKSKKVKLILTCLYTFLLKSFMKTNFSKEIVIFRFYVIILIFLAVCLLTDLSISICIHVMKNIAYFKREKTKIEKLFCLI